MNVIVIITDSLRADHVGCHPSAVSYNGRRIETPNLDRLAAEGISFTHACAESLPTMPTRQQWAVRDRDWTALININPDAGRLGTPYELYDRRRDPLEQEDRAGELPEVIDSLELALLRELLRLP